jgi:flavin reductase (DIM6/NTAB) family NADH-FMN oxidoreductase RutF
MEAITNGYYIVTALKPAAEMETRNKDYLAAGTVNWLTQLSFEPTLVGVSVAIFSDLNETIDKSGSFTIHVISDKHLDWVEKFATKSEITDSTINGINFKKENGEVVLEDTMATLKCNLKESVRCGDHTQHIGEVVEANRNEKIAPLSTVALPSSYKPENMPKTN